MHKLKRNFAVLLLLFALFGANQLYMRAAVPALKQAQEGIPLPILMYHSILKDSARQGKYVCSPDQLKNDLLYLKEHGYEAVNVSDLISYVQNGTPLPQKPVMITFDDGYYNNYLYAYPILKETGMKGVLSVVGKLTESFSETGETNAYWSHVTLEQIKEMSDSGIMEIQNHSYNLHSTKKRRGCLRMKGEDKGNYKVFLQADTLKTQHLLEQAGLPVPNCYTYPFGSLNQESEEIIKELGFPVTLGCEEHVSRITRDWECLYKLGRFNRASGPSSAEFLKKILQEAEQD